VSREQVLDAIARYPGAIVLVTHDPGAVLASSRPCHPAARRRRGRLERRPARTRRTRLASSQIRDHDLKVDISPRSCPAGLIARRDHQEVVGGVTRGWRGRLPRRSR
jgi:hypothetical protein